MFIDLNIWLTGPSAPYVDQVEDRRRRTMFTVTEGYRSSLINTVIADRGIASAENSIVGYRKNR